MSHSQEILDILETWKSKRFRPNEITFGEAAASLSSTSPLIVAKPGSNRSKWIMMSKVTDNVAILVHVGVWKWAGNLETGNFVPEGEQAPDSIPNDRIQDRPSFKCEFSYAFDTTVDASLWDNMKVFEDHVSQQEGFNKGKRLRRSWQNGKNPLHRDKYIVSSRVFTRRSPHNTKAGGEYKVPYNVHPWLSKAVKDFDDLKQIPNPERPLYYDFTEGYLQRLQDTPDPQFNHGDIILMSCKLGFVVTGDSWWPEIVPLEMIRVGKLPEAVSSKSDSAMYPALGGDFTPLALGAPIDLYEEMIRTAKRKERENDDQVPPNKRQEIGPEITTESSSNLDTDKRAATISEFNSEIISIPNLDVGITSGQVTDSDANSMLTVTEAELTPQPDGQTMSKNKVHTHTDIHVAVTDIDTDTAPHKVNNSSATNSASEGDGDTDDATTASSSDLIAEKRPFNPRPDAVDSLTRPNLRPKQNRESRGQHRNH